jgi:hypothetical protein
LVANFKPGLQKMFKFACLHVFQCHHRLNQAWMWGAQPMMSALIILHVKINSV